MVELIITDELRELMVEKFNLQEDILSRTRLFIAGSVVHGVLDWTVNWMAPYTEEVKLSDASPWIIEQDVKAVRETRDLIDRYEQELARYNWFTKITDRKGYRITEECLASQREVLEHHRAKLKEDEAKTTAVSKTRRVSQRIQVIYFYWNVDYDAEGTIVPLGDMNVLNNAPLTRPEVSQILTKGGFTVFDLEHSPYDETATTMNDNLILATLKQDKKLFEAVAEQASKNRQDDKVKVFLALDKKYKIKFINCNLEQAVR